MHKLHSRQPVFAYSAYGQFTNHDEMIQKLKETCDLIRKQDR